MIEFKKLKLKNILSYGNHVTEIDLGSHKSTLVVGTNGTGKSSCIEALSFGLYGKPYRKINKGQLVNSTNKKDCLVEVEFATSGVDYRIIRGIKPNIFEIYADGELLFQDSSVAVQQANLEADILKMSFKSYCQIVVLGTATFKPFMQLSAAERREFIEDLIGLEIFSKMNTILKERVSDNKAQLIENKSAIELNDYKISAFNEKKKIIEANQDSKVAKIKEDIKATLKQIDDCQAEKTRISDEMVIQESKLSDVAALQAKAQKLNNLKSGIKANMDSHRSDAKFFASNKDCPTCRQLIDEVYKESIIQKNDLKISEFGDALKELSDRLSLLEEKIAGAKIEESKMASLKLEYSNECTSIKLHTQTLMSLKAGLKEVKVNSVEIGDNSELLTTKQTLTDEREGLLKSRDVFSVAAKLLKDGGIKAKIISKYVPIINAKINGYLSEFDFYAGFLLDENFEETIVSRGRDTFAYDSFSQGEKAKIDISLMLTWRQIARLRNSVSTSLLIMDEVFDGSTDAEGVENLKKILNKEDGQYIVISHKTETHDSYFDRVFEATKSNGFTNLVEATEQT